MLVMAWHLRVFELPGGRWSCRWSKVELGEHDTLEAAVRHLEELAKEVGPSKVILHTLGGEIRVLAEFDDL